jgi:hypothetical protein
VPPDNFEEQKNIYISRHLESYDLLFPSYNGSDEDKEWFVGAEVILKNIDFHEYLMTTCN